MCFNCFLWWFMTHHHGGGFLNQTYRSSVHLKELHTYLLMRYSSWRFVVHCEACFTTPNGPVVRSPLSQVNG